MKAPPRSGKGSGTKEWAEYARSLGHEIPKSAKRADIIALVEAGPPPGPHRTAIEEQVEAMATGQEHRALVEACRELADLLDSQRRDQVFDDKAWREYRLALNALREAVTDGGTGGDLEEWLKDSRGQVRDT